MISVTISFLFINIFPFLFILRVSLTFSLFSLLPHSILSSVAWTSESIQASLEVFDSQNDIILYILVNWIINKTPSKIVHRQTIAINVMYDHILAWFDPTAEEYEPDLLINKMQVTILLANKSFPYPPPHPIQYLI